MLVVEAESLDDDDVSCVFGREGRSGSAFQSFRVSFLRDFGKA
jgi:hypothetical protein